MQKTPLVEFENVSGKSQMSSIVISKRKNSLSLPNTTFTEKILLMLTIILIPLENNLPVVAGFSAIYILFLVLGMYIFINRLKELERVVTHPVFLAAYVMIFICSLVESYHPYPSYSILIRFGQMIVGGLLVASLCRNRSILKWGLYGFLVAGLWMAILLFLTSYGTLSAASASNFREASHLREEAFAENPLEANLNGMAKITGLGFIIAFAMILGKGSSGEKKILMGIAGFCLLATFLPMSRSGLVAVLMAGATIMVARGIGIKIILMVLVFGIGIVALVPDAVFSRLTFSTEKSRSGKMEARAYIYTAALETIDQYVLTGVGSGNFWESWGRHTKFLHPTHGIVIGPHNSFIATTIYWGIPGLLSLLILIYQAYRCLPRRSGVDSLCLCLLGLSVSLVMNMMASHVLAAKAFSLGLGLLVGYRCWIWPKDHRQSVYLAKLQNRKRRQEFKNSLVSTKIYPSKVGV